MYSVQRIIIITITAIVFTSHRRQLTGMHVRKFGVHWIYIYLHIFFCFVRVPTLYSEYCYNTFRL